MTHPTPEQMGITARLSLHEQAIHRLIEIQRELVQMREMSFGFDVIDHLYKATNEIVAAGAALQKLRK